jgi:hypothetical protein
MFSQDKQVRQAKHARQVRQERQEKPSKTGKASWHIDVKHILGFNLLVTLKKTIESTYFDSG